MRTFNEFLDYTSKIPHMKPYSYEQKEAIFEHLKMLEDEGIYYDDLIAYLRDYTIYSEEELRKEYEGQASLEEILRYFELNTSVFTIGDTYIIKDF